MIINQVSSTYRFSYVEGSSPALWLPRRHDGVRRVQGRAPLPLTSTIYDIFLPPTSPSITFVPDRLIHTQLLQSNNMRCFFFSDQLLVASGILYPFLCWYQILVELNQNASVYPFGNCVLFSPFSTQPTQEFVAVPLPRDFELCKHGLWWWLLLKLWSKGGPRRTSGLQRHEMIQGTFPSGSGCINKLGNYRGR